MHIKLSQPGFTWLSLTICHYQLLLFVSPLDSTQCLHRDNEYKFMLVGHHLWVSPCSSSSTQCVLHILLEWLVRWEVKWLYHSSFIGCCFQDLFKTEYSIFCSFIKVQVVQPYNITDMTTIWKNLHFIL